MDSIKILEIKEETAKANNKNAEFIRKELKDKGVFFLNIMSSPGSGKTTLLVNLINRLKNDFRIGVMEADIDSAEDAYTISEKTGVKAVQIHTGGACHMTSQMAYEALNGLDADNFDLVILENIGNLVCPAEFDTGAAKNLVLLSVPEGDDKPLKYPLMFEVASCVAVTKTDVKEIFDFSFDKAEENVRKRNRDCPVFFVSAKKNEGVDALEAYLRGEIRKIRE